MLGLGLGRGGDRDARVHPCWPGSLTALCSGPRRGLARGCRWAGPGGTAAARQRRATPSAARAAAAGCLPSGRLRKEALRPSPRVGAARVAKGGVQEDAGARSPGLRALRRWEGLGGTWTLRSAVGEGRGGAEGLWSLYAPFCPAKAADLVCLYVPCIGEGSLGAPGGDV